MAAKFCEMPKISGAKSIIGSKFYPKFWRGNRVKNGKNFRNFYYLGLGGNIGNTRKIFENFVLKLQKDRRFFVRESSPILLNKAFGYTAQDDFLNAVLLVNSSIYANEMLKITQHFEKIFGRKRSFKNAPRTLDIDILYFDKKHRNTKHLTLPHRGANERLSVIIPIGLMKGI